MQALHHQHNGAMDLVIETGEEGVLVPLGTLVPSRLGLGILWLDRIIDDDDVAAPAGQGAAYGGREPISALGGADFGLGVLGFVDAASRKCPLRPRSRA
jgi:hypothetical protein